MTVQQVEILCGKTLQLLEELEGLLAQCPRAVEFVYKSIAAVKEIRCIARLESVTNVTNEQARHLQKIANQCNDFLRKLSQ